MGEEKKGNWWIWRVFWILLFITTFEVVLGILKVNEKLPEFIVYDKFLGLAWLTHIFIILTIMKAAYIVMTFMHLGDERKKFKMDNFTSRLYFSPISSFYFV